MKNEKFLLDIQTKCGDIAKEMLNVVIDAEQTFKCKWTYAWVLTVKTGLMKPLQTNKALCQTYTKVLLIYLFNRLKIDVSIIQKLVS